MMTVLHMLVFPFQQATIKLQLLHSSNFCMATLLIGYRWCDNHYIEQHGTPKKVCHRLWLSHALCTPGQHTAKRRRKCTRQSNS